MQPAQQGGDFFRVGAGKRKGDLLQLDQGRLVDQHAVEEFPQLAHRVLLLAIDVLLGFPLSGVAVGLYSLQEGFR